MITFFFFCVFVIAGHLCSAREMKWNERKQFFRQTELLIGQFFANFLLFASLRPFVIEYSSFIHFEFHLNNSLFYLHFSFDLPSSIYSFFLKIQIPSLIHRFHFVSRDGEELIEYTERSKLWNERKMEDCSLDLFSSICLLFEQKFVISGEAKAIAIATENVNFFFLRLLSL